MLINQDWSTPKKLEYGKNITVQFSKPNFLIKISSPDGTAKQQEVTTGKQYEIRAAEISAISHPHISLKSLTNEEIHVRVEDPAY